jgi:hypothetical protein
MSSTDLTKIRFQSWKWTERRTVSKPVDVDRRKTDFTISQKHLTSHEENLRWESELVSDALDKTRKRKFFAISASMIIFPGLIGGMLSVVSVMTQIGIKEADFQWLSIVSISMFIGIANMVTIKYIAAYKAQANLFIRQLNCLRQARDSLTYYKFEGEYPIHLRSLVEEGIYYKVFGRHRKLYIGNEELRDRLGGSFSDSADKSLICFLFLTSLTLISAPIVCLAAFSLNGKTVPDQYPYVLNGAHLIFLTMSVLFLAVMLFVIGHWKNFKRLRTDHVTKKNYEKKDASKYKYDPIFSLNLRDYIAILLILVSASLWAYKGWSSRPPTVANALLVVLAICSMFLIVMSVKKVFFDSLNRIHKSLFYRININFNNDEEEKISGFLDDCIGFLKKIWEPLHPSRKERIDPKETTATCAHNSFNKS